MSLKETAAAFLDAPCSETVLLTSTASGATPLLDIRSEFRTEAEGKRFHSHKRTSFGLDAKRRISRAAGALDRLDSDVSNYLFLTATLPGDTDEAKWGIAEYAHEIIDGLKSWLSKRLLDRKEFYVWENQKRGALHFHYCIYCPNKSTQAEITANFKAQLVRLYDGIQEKYHCNLWGRYGDYSNGDKIAILQARVEVVYKSVGAYMAGYLAGKGDKHYEDANHRYYPKRWFGVSRPLSAAIDSMTEKREYEFTSLNEAGEFYHSESQDFLDDVLTDREYPHKVGEGRTRVFYHTTEKQLELWQAKQVLKHTPANHPHISAYIQTGLKTTQELLEASKKSKYLREKLPTPLLSALRDSMFVTSLKHGVLKSDTVRTLERIFSSLDFSSASCPATRNCFSSLLKFNLLTSHYHPQMRFNQWGVLSNPDDFSQYIDNRKALCDTRTRLMSMEPGGSPDSYSPLVGSEPNEPPSLTQICLFSD